MIAWLAAIERRDGPTCLVLSRQNLPHFNRDAQQLRDVRKGGYVLAEAPGTLALTLLATGSEVALAMQARDALAGQGVGARVVSMPSCGDFDAQDAPYRAAVLPRSVPVLAIEAGVSRFWRAYTGFDGDVIGIDRYGESAPAAPVAEALGLTVTAVTERALALARGGVRP
jgi:transketolase